MEIKYICECHNKEFKNRHSLTSHLYYMKIKDSFKYKEPRKIYNNKYYIKNTDKRKKYRINNKEKILNYLQKYNKDNKEKIESTHKVYREIHKEKILGYAKKYYQINKEEQKERMKEYHKTPEGKLVNKIYEHNKRTILKGSTKLTKEIIYQVYKKCTNSKGEYICVCCFKPIIKGQEELEHNIPITRHNEFFNINLNDISNLGLAHGINSIEKCNKRKHTKTLEEWFKQRNIKEKIDAYIS